MSLENESQQKKSLHQAFISRTDIIIIIFFLLVTVVFLGLSLAKKTGKAESVVISHNGEEYQTVDLKNIEAPYEINVGGHVVVEVDKNRARIKESDCKDQICVKAGWLTKPGDTAICLPNKVAITITGKPKDVDFIAGS